MRIDKYLSACGVASRSEARKLIRKGAVTVSGEKAKSPDQKIDETTDLICVNGIPLSYTQYHYYLFYKPPGCVTAKSDQRHRTVMDYFADNPFSKQLAPVGRLDLDTEGLMIVTDDGALAHHLISPSHHVEKTYLARLDKPVPAWAKERFREGIDIGDEKPTLPAELSWLDEDRKQCLLTITEGRYHQVKRMFSAAGCQVVALKRVSMGTLTLGDLAVGEYRELAKKEIEGLQHS